MSEWSPFENDNPPLILTPAERQYLLRLLGGPLEGGKELRATDVLVLRGKLESGA